MSLIFVLSEAVVIIFSGYLQEPNTKKFKGKNDDTQTKENKEASGSLLNNIVDQKVRNDMTAIRF